MRTVGDKQAGTIGPGLERSIRIDSRGAKVTADAGFFLRKQEENTG